MATRLLFFLTRIGDSLLKQSAAEMGPAWEITRMVNYHHGLARMSLIPPPGADATQLRGEIFLQSYRLSDGSLCLKANLSWQGCERFSAVTVYTKPGLDWGTVTAQIASAWLAGPLPTIETATDDGLRPLMAAAS